MNPRRTALIGTLLTAAALTLLLFLGRLTFDPSGLRVPPRPVTELIPQEEEFVDFLDPQPVRHNPSPAHSEEQRKAESHAAEASGADITDAGSQGPAAPDVVSERPAPVKKPERDKVKPGSTKKQKEDLEKVRRQAREGVADAFKAKPDAKDNTDAKGRAKGDSGTPDGKPSNVDGSGHGSVGGGWIMPHYAKVPSNVTGRIELRAIVGADGRVKSVEQTGGKAPAGSNAALVNKCIAEVKARKFTRNDDDPPERAVATIIYTFK